MSPRTAEVCEAGHFLYGISLDTLAALTRVGFPPNSRYSKLNNVLKRQTYDLVARLQVA